MAVLAVYGRAGRFEFVHYDDQVYVSQNVHMREGLTAANVDWALTSCGYAGNWHPLAWMSMMLDVSVDRILRGGKISPNAEWFVTESRLAAIMHLHNVVLHAANALLLFLLLLQLLEQTAPTAGPFDGKAAEACAFVLCLLWALHPLRNEVVCWVSERKELTSVFFMLLSLIFYCRRDRKMWHVLFASVGFLLALSAKPVAVTLPAVFFAWDWLWLRSVSGRRMALYAAMSLAAAYLTLISQTEAVETGNAITLASRVVSVIEAPIVYLQQTLWPRDLSIVYAASEAIHPVKAVFGVGLVVASAVLLVRGLVMRTGWSCIGCFAVMWAYVGLLPMLGIVKAGNMEHADRYTYWVGCGVCAAVAFAMRRLMPHLCRRASRMWKVILVVFLSVLAVLVIVTRDDMSRWQSTKHLFKEALRVMEGPEAGV